MRVAPVILGELGYVPLGQAGGTLLFHLLSKLYEHTIGIIATKPEYRRMIECFRRRQDDHGLARLARLSFLHCGDW